MPGIALAPEKVNEVQALLRQKASHRAIREVTGVSLAAISGIRQTLKNLPTPLPSEQVTKKVSEYEWDEWAEHLEKGQELRHKASGSQIDAHIKLGDGTTPQILLPWGDQHIGCYGTDYGRLRAMTHELVDTPNVWSALMGDPLQMAIRMRSVAEVTGQIEPKHQMGFFRSWLKKIAPKVAFSVWCNHGVEREEKQSGVSLLADILSEHTVYFSGIGHPDVQVGKQVYRFAASHKFRGSSMYDSTYAQKRYARMEANDREIILMADIHRPGLSVYADGGVKRICLTSGTNQTKSAYAQRYFSLRTVQEFPCVVLHADQHKAVPFWNLDEALKYIGQ